MMTRWAAASSNSERERFTLAHEVGHLVLDCAADIPGEKAANRFAGAFLMPAEVLWAEVGKQRDSLSIGELIELKRVFGVSLQMLVYRCRDLRIITDELYRDLFRDFRDRGWRDPPYRISDFDADHTHDVPIGRACVDMIVAQDLCTRTGVLLVLKGYRVCESFLARLGNFNPDLLPTVIRMRKTPGLTEPPPPRRRRGGK